MRLSFLRNQAVCLQKAKNCRYFARSIFRSLRTNIGLVNTLCAYSNRSSARERFCHSWLSGSSTPFCSRPTSSLKAHRHPLTARGCREDEDSWCGGRAPFRIESQKCIVFGNWRCPSTLELCDSPLETSRPPWGSHIRFVSKRALSLRSTSSSSSSSETRTVSDGHGVSAQHSFKHGTVVETFSGPIFLAS